MQELRVNNLFWAAAVTASGAAWNSAYAYAHACACAYAYATASAASAAASAAGVSASWL